MKSKQDFNSVEEYHEYLKTHIAIAAMQADLSRRFYTPSEVADSAVKYADALIAELNKDK